jgi:hypothetical protein
MYYRPPDNFLYSGYKLFASFSDGTSPISTSATCFVLELDNGTPYIVTNRHVIDINYPNALPQYQNYRLASLRIVGRRPTDDEYTINIEPTGIYYHTNVLNDVVLIRPSTRDANPANLHWRFGQEHLATQQMLNQFKPFDVICYSGFPVTHDQSMGRPIVRRGSIASDPMFDYSWESNPKGNIIAFEGFSTPGASGSPIFAPTYGVGGVPGARAGYLLGVNAGRLLEAGAHSGISYFFKSSVIIEIIEHNGLNPAIV